MDIFFEFIISLKGFLMDNNELNEEDLLYMFKDVVESGEKIIIAKGCPEGYGYYYGQCCKGKGLGDINFHCLE